MNANKRLHWEQIVILSAMIYSPSSSSEPQAVRLLQSLPFPILSIRLTDYESDDRLTNGAIEP
jgi:hypothetical protein